MKKVFRYATGEPIPEGAVYLSTVTNGIMPSQGSDVIPEGYEYVWHYFLVEVKK